MKGFKGFSDPLAAHGSWRYDLATNVIEWSDSVYRLHGVAPGSFRPTREEVRKLIHPDDRDMYGGIVREAIASRSPFTVQHRIVRPDGVERAVIVRGAYLPNDDGASGHLVGTTRDVTAQLGEEERLWHLANEDGLTHLFNRRRFMDELEREVAVARRSRTPGAVLMLDLDRFKEVNDSLGHMAGDALLMRVAHALRARLRATDTLGRLGGDEFALVLPACTSQEAEDVARQLSASLSETATVQIAGRERHVTASIGITPLGIRSNDTADALLVEADLAMYRAKAKGPGTIEVFDEEMRAELAARLQVEAELREAIEHDQLRVVFQPIVSLVEGGPVGFEALVRWQHPTRGLVPPAEFVPVAEEYGLIEPIGRWVLDRACREAKLWRRAGQNAFAAVNLSPRQLAGTDIVGAVRDALESADLAPELLCLEITETSLSEDTSPLVPALHGLRELGVRLALDDFGGGASSLGLLRMLPIDVIKIDRIFISGIAERRDDRAIVAAVLSLAEELELTVIAEGVEDERQHWELRELGCNYAQGFLYSRPVPAEKLDVDADTSAVQSGVGAP
jgi:diguanylate cyclase (GGDEF)-like protein/PAS domain S-box-containing protein